MGRVPVGHHTLKTVFEEREKKVLSKPLLGRFHLRKVTREGKTSISEHKGARKNGTPQKEQGGKGWKKVLRSEDGPKS